MWKVVHELASPTLGLAFLLVLIMVVMVLLSDWSIIVDLFQ